MFDFFAFSSKFVVIVSRIMFFGTSLRIWFTITTFFLTLKEQKIEWLKSLVSNCKILPGFGFFVDFPEPESMKKTLYLAYLEFLFFKKAEYLMIPSEMSLSFS